MDSLAPLIVAQNASYSSGADYIAVVDPETRKLLVPRDCVLNTRAKQRTTIPSLCCLFMRGCCRQFENCHQVHASTDVIQELRKRVGNLPKCCAEHFDDDIAGVLQKHSWLANVFLHIPDSKYNNGYIPLKNIGYTIPISEMLHSLPESIYQTLLSYKNEVESGQTPTSGPPRVVLEPRGIPICRLHVVDRCRYADECSFLHICKHVYREDPNLPLGRRPRGRCGGKPFFAPFAPPRAHGVLNAFPVYAPHARPPLRGASPNRRVGTPKSDASSAASTPFTTPHDPHTGRDGHEGEVWRKRASIRLQPFLGPAIAWEQTSDGLANSTRTFASPLSLRGSRSLSAGIVSLDASLNVSTRHASINHATSRVWRHDPYKGTPASIMGGV